MAPIIPELGNLPGFPDAPVDPTGPVVIRGAGSGLQMNRGAESGRVIEEDGSVVFVLGDRTPLNRREMTTGEYIQASKMLTLDDLDLIAFTASAEVGEVRHPNVAWFAQILVDGIQLAEKQLPAERTMPVTDVAAPVRRYTGDHSVAFRLALVEV